MDSGLRGKGRIVAAILLSCLFLMGQSVISPLLSRIQADFPGSSDAAVQLVYSIPMLSQIPAAFFVSWLAKRVSCKSLGAAATAAIILGGLIPLFRGGGLAQLYVSSAVLGLGMGASNIVAAELIFKNFSGKARTRMFGLFTISFCAGSGLLSLLSGQLAKTSWSASYLCYLLNIPILVAYLLLLPRDRPAAKAEGGRNKRVVFTGRVLYLSALTTLYSVFHNAFGANIAMLLSERGLGGPTLAGFIGTLNFTMGVLAGLALPRLTSRLRELTVPSALMMTALGLLIIAFSRNAALVALGALCCGAGFAVKGPSCTNASGAMMPEGSSAFGMSVYKSSNNLGYFVSPLIVNPLSALFSAGRPARFIVCGAGIVLLGALMFLKNPILREETF